MLASSRWIATEHVQGSIPVVLIFSKSNLSVSCSGQPKGDGVQGEGAEGEAGDPHLLAQEPPEWVPCAEIAERFIEDQAFLSTPPPFVSLLGQWHTGRLRNIDNLLLGEGGRGWARSRIIQPQENMVLYKSFNILWPSVFSSSVSRQFLRIAPSRTVYICLLKFSAKILASL